MKLNETFQFIYSPSDLSAHLSCNHLLQLNKKRLLKEIAPPDIRENKVLDLLRKRGLEFEQNYLQQKIEEGLSVVKISMEDSEAERKTIEAMKNGVDYIYQARLIQQGKWSGWADFLKKVEMPSELGPWSYEVWDTKLATETRAGTILQISLYSERVSEIQGVNPEKMGVIKPDGEESYRVDDYASYVRWVKSRLEHSITNDADTYPEPVSHCDVCQWWKHCDSVRRKDDHLHYVANMGTSQIKELKSHGISTLEQLATSQLLNFKPNKGSIETFIKLKEQARIQWESRNENYAPKYELLTVLPKKGFNRLPLPSDNDVYLDLEGDPLIEPSGLEYLIGYVYNNEYKALWAYNEEEEKQAFENFVDFVFDLKQKQPEMHIYHYAPYEVTAFKRLMGKYATRENEIDFLLRSETFVDLYAVVRQSLRASVEKYSIKDLEQFYNYQRQIELRTLSPIKAEFEYLLEINSANEINDEQREAIYLYNQDDCLSTKHLHVWLEELRSEVIAQGQLVTRPISNPGDAGKKTTEHQERIKPIFDSLIENVPISLENRTKEQQAKFILAHMLDWYRREKKSFWWEYFRLKELPEDELLDELKAITKLEKIGERQPEKRSVIDSYTFPDQEYDLKINKEIKNNDGKKVGDLVEVDRENRIIRIKKGPSLKDELDPVSIFQIEDISSIDKEAAIIRFAEWVVDNGLEAEATDYRCARDLLLKLSPRFMQTPIVVESLLGNAFNKAMQLEHSVLPIQGPPGAGKSYTASNMIIQLIRENKKIGVTALSHKVITNLIQKVHEIAKKEEISIKIIQKVSKDFDGTLPWDFTKKGEDIPSSIEEYDLIAGTPFMWCLPEYFETLDYLFVDEAGQLSLIDTLSISASTKNLILLGDPQQLKQPQQGVHPEGTDLSALEHILDGKKTISNDQGIFLSETWRMHPSICKFDSEMFYEDKLRPIQNLEHQQIIGNTQYQGSGLRLVDVSHSGNTNSSLEEVAKIKEIVEELTKGDVYWINQHQEQILLTHEHIKIITPYNAQVQELQKSLSGVAVGTVDKFQGQEAPIIIYSVATSTPQDAPRGMDFLYSPNRFNVAVSRARALFIMVMNKKVLEPECKSPLQIKLANPFCRFVEMESK
jgi:predicted RecB family nuclease